MGLETHDLHITSQTCGMILCWLPTFASNVDFHILFYTQAINKNASVAIATIVKSSCLWYSMVSWVNTKITEYKELSCKLETGKYL